MKIHKNSAFFAKCTVFALSALVVAGAIVASTNDGGESSALTYQTESNISFTFSPMISISVSSNTIDIPTLVPGTTAESNPITVTVSTNTAYGYSLYADVGNSTDYNTDSLVHSSNDNSNNNADNSIPSTFTNIATNASLSQLTTDNTWGYSYKPSNESTWSTYNGLPLYSTTDSHTSTSNPALLIDTKDPGDDKSIDFKIAAKSSSTQPSGTYNNVINFYAIGKKPPTIDDIEYMQDFTSGSESIKSSMAEHVTYTLKDKRDEQEYTVAKLKDGKIWMTKNLNLAGGSVITSELSDVPNDYVLPVANGFQSGNKLPDSTTAGFNDGTKAFVYNSAKVTGTECFSPGCYSYYSWVAATAGSGLNVAADSTDASYSICPRGWKLPNSRESIVDESDFYGLAVAYGMDPDSTHQATRDFYDQAGPGTIPNFVLAGRYYNGVFSNGGSNGAYWSSTAGSDTYAWLLFFGSSDVNSAGYGNRWFGFSVRCIAK